MTRIRRIPADRLKNLHTISDYLLDHRFAGTRMTRIRVFETAHIRVIRVP